MQISRVAQLEVLEHDGLAAHDDADVVVAVLRRGQQLVLQRLGGDGRGLDLGQPPDPETLDDVGERQRPPATLTDGQRQAQVGQRVEVGADPARRQRRALGQLFGVRLVERGEHDVERLGVGGDAQRLQQTSTLRSC
jgi:hypothetical protein